MTWHKASEHIQETFLAALPKDPSVQRKKMFGYPSAFVGGNMFAGVFQENILVRLPAERRQTLIASGGGAQFEPMPGRPMREYVVLPASVVEEGQTLAAIVAEAFAFGASMPAKETKRAKKKTA